MTFNRIIINGPILLIAIASVRYEGKVQPSGAWLTIKGSSTQTPLISSHVDKANMTKRSAVR